MAGLKIALPMSFTGAGLAYLRDDAVLPAVGAMMLIDPTHPAAPWAAGVPADQSYLPNLAADQLGAMLGSTAAADVSPKMIAPAAFTGSAGKLERTGKGGLHGISPKAGTAIAGSGPVLAFSTKLMAYILANPKHDYYLSLWYRVTRWGAEGYGNSTIAAINGSGQQTNSFLFNVALSNSASTGATTVRPSTSDGVQLGKHEDPLYTPNGGNKFVGISTDKWYTATAGLNDSLPGDGTNASVTGAVAGGGLTFGATTSWPGIGTTGSVSSALFNPTGGSSNKDKADSHVLYRCYLEDLTVSGRSYAAVDALEFAQYQKHVLTAGGRYYGDTFTDPATVP